MALKQEIIGKELIIPASPTPDHLRTLQLSLCDLFSPPIYVVGIFFYTAEDHMISKETVSLRLKKSLSEILTRFYPLAGRIQGVSINCNDEGAVFVEARADCLLSEFLRNPVRESIEQFVPSESDISGGPPETLPLLNVKVTYFRSGGLVMAVGVSHHVFDTSSLSLFVNMWAATARGYGDSMAPPEFAETSIFPPADLSIVFRPPTSEDSDAERGRLIWKRFVFGASKIGELKRRAESESVKNPTRVEAVTTLIWRCVAKAWHSNSNTYRPSTLLQVMDMRRRSRSTNLPQNTIGNLIPPFLVKEEPESEMDISKLVAKLREKKEELSDKIKQNLQLDRNSSELHGKMKELLVKFLSEIESEKRPYITTSWCGFPFYEVDFGWGRPAWFAPACHLLYEIPDFTYLIDANDGEEIEAWVTLSEQDMLVFEHEPELLAVATPNPTLLN